jgi:hypothetical protein
MLADVAVWLIRSRRALGWYHDGNKSLWSASELREKYERMLCALADLIELRLKLTIPSDDSAARWLTRFATRNSPMRLPLHYPRLTVMYVRNTALIATIRQTHDSRQSGLATAFYDDQELAVQKIPVCRTVVIATGFSNI